jgi:hypothetical protein
LDAAANSEPGTLLQRALELEYALKAGVTISLDEIAADEFWAMRVIKEERDETVGGYQRVPADRRRPEVG